MLREINKKISGSTILKSDGTETDIHIGPFDPSRTLISCSVTSNRPYLGGIFLAYRLVGSNTLRLNLANMSTQNAVVEWQVMEFTEDSGITVQHGTSIGTKDVIISPVTVSESHVDISYTRPDSMSKKFDLVRAKITANNILSVTDEFNGTCYWQIVDWNGHAKVSHVDIDIKDTDSEFVNVLINLTDYTKAIVVGRFELLGYKNKIRTCLPRLTSNNNLQIEKSDKKAKMALTIQIIEFVYESITVQQYYGNIVSGNLTTDIPLPVINGYTSFVIANGSCCGVVGTNTHSNSLSESLFNFNLHDPKKINLQRLSASQNSTFMVNVVSFDVNPIHFKYTTTGNCIICRIRPLLSPDVYYCGDIKCDKDLTYESPYDMSCFKNNGKCQFGQRFCLHNDGADNCLSSSDYVALPDRIVGNWETFGHRKLN